MFMLDRFEHCDLSFKERPFADKFQILASILTKCEMEYLVSKLSTVEKRLRDHAFVEESPITEHLKKTDPTLARQFYEYWQSYELDCGAINQFRNGMMSDQFGQDPIKDVELLKIGKRHIFGVYWAIEYMTQGKCNH